MNATKSEKAKSKNGVYSWLGRWAEQNGYQMTVEKGRLGVRNLVFGSPDTARVIFAAHYDTCAVQPFPNFIAPRNLFVTFAYQLLVAAVIVVPALLYCVALLPCFVAFLSRCFIALLYCFALLLFYRAALLR